MSYSFMIPHDLLIYFSQYAVHRDFKCPFLTFSFFCAIFDTSKKFQNNGELYLSPIPTVSTHLSPFNSVAQSRKKCPNAHSEMPKCPVLNLGIAHSKIEYWALGISEWAYGHFFSIGHRNQMDLSVYSCVVLVRRNVLCNS